MENFVLMDESTKNRALTEQLISHFKLNEDPFSIENSCFFEDAQRKHNIETLRHLSIFGDMVLLLTGEIGAGKTSLIERFVQTHSSELKIFVHKNAAQFIRNRSGVEKPENGSSVNCFAELDGLAGVEGERADQTLFRLIQKCDLTFQESGKRTLLVIDDADLLSKEELQLYFSVFRSLPVESGVVLLLVGTPTLLRFASEGGEGLDEKLHQIQLKPLTSSEMVEYIQCRLASAGCLEQISLSEGQRETLAKMGKGLPGRINRFFAYIVFELGLPEAETSSVNHMAHKVLLSIAGLLLLSFVLVSYQHGLLDFSSMDFDGMAEQEVDESNGDHQAKIEKENLIALQRDARLKMLDLAIIESAPDDEILAPQGGNDTIVGSPSSNVAASSESKSKNVLTVEPESVSQMKLSKQSEIRSVAEAVVVPVSNEIIKKRASNTNVSAVKSNSVVVKSVASNIDVGAIVTSKSVAKEKLSKMPESFRSKSWVVSQPSTNYSAQLLGSYSEETAIKFIEQAGIVDPELYYLKTLYKGRDWFVVFYGSFASKKVAQKSVSTASSVVQKQGPWLRQFDGILSSYPK